MTVVGTLKPEDIIEACLHGETLKRLRRTGWTIAGVSESETVASHVFGTCLVSLLIAVNLQARGLDIDLGRVMAMAVLHDLPEALTSDIPHTALELGGRSLKNGRSMAERNAIEMILAPLEQVGASLRAMWTEFIASKSLESEIVAAADSLDLLLHAVKMERGGVSPEILDGFFLSVYGKLRSSRVETVLDLLNALLKEHRKNAETDGVNVEQTPDV